VWVNLRLRLNGNTGIVRRTERRSPVTKTFWQKLMAEFLEEWDMKMELELLGQAPGTWNY
jgi:hypothetical protein